MMTNTYFRKRYQEFVENIPGGYFVYTADEKERIIAANTECFKIFQCNSVEEFMQLTNGSFRSLVYEDDYIPVVNRINTQLHVNATGYDHVMYRIKRADGTIRWIDDYGHLVNDAKFGKVFHVFITDITDEVNNFDWMNRNHLLAFINESIPGGYYKCHIDEGYPFEFVSQKFLEILGYTRAELHVLFWDKYLNLVHPDDRKIVLKYAQKLLENPGMNIVSPEYRMMGKEKTIWVVESAKALATGEKTVFQGIIIDVSVQHDLHVSNRELEAQMQTMDVFKTLADDFINAHYVDGETGIATAYRIGEWEKRNWNAYVGIQYPYELMMNGFFRTIVYDEYVAELRPYADYKAVLQKLEEIKPASIIKQFKGRHDGESLYFELKISAYYQDEKIIGFVVAMKNCDDDVREEKAKKKMLAETLTQTQQQLKVIGGLCKEYDSVYYVDIDKDTAIPFVRSEVIEKEYPMGDTFWAGFEQYVKNSVANEDKAFVLEMTRYDVVRKQLSKMDAYEIKYCTTHTGRRRHFQLRIMCVGEENEQVWAFRNIEKIVQEHVRQEKKLKTALKKAKAAENAKTTFLFHMSHDIRTPMNAILGYATMAERHIEDQGKVLDYLQKLQIAGAQLQGLISGVLDMAKIESGKMEITERLCSIPQIVQEIKTMFSLEMERKNIDFQVICDVTDHMVYMDDVKMIQVETNLIGNALKYTEPGGKVTYTVRQIGEAKNGYATYEARVKDNGRGISKEFLKNVFVPFQRERNSTIAKIEGTGLGLAITKNLIEMLGGTIVCNSTPGEGTEFVYQIRMKVGEDNSIKMEETLESPICDFRNVRVLLAEDNELNSEIAEELLAMEGCKVEKAENGAIAVQKVRMSEPGYYDVILMDIQMPVLDGYEAAKAIRKLQNRGLSNIPIIAMTANAFEDDKRQAVTCGMNAHISKPIDVEHMLKTISSVLCDSKGK